MLHQDRSFWSSLDSKRDNWWLNIACPHVMVQWLFTEIPYVLLIDSFFIQQKSFCTSVWPKSQNYRILLYYVHSVNYNSSPNVKFLSNHMVCMSYHVFRLSFIKKNCLSRFGFIVSIGKHRAFSTKNRKPRGFLFFVWIVVDLWCFKYYPFLFVVTIRICYLKQKMTLKALCEFRKYATHTEKNIGN